MSHHSCGLAQWKTVSIWKFLFPKRYTIKLPLTTLGEAIEQRESVQGEREKDTRFLPETEREVIHVPLEDGSRHFAGHVLG